MKAYRVTTPNEGTRYAREIHEVIELLNNDGWDWLNSGPFHHFIKSEGIESHIKYSPSVLRRMLGSWEGLFYQYDDSQYYYPEPEIIERAYIIIEVINI